MGGEAGNGGYFLASALCTVVLIRCWNPAKGTHLPSGAYAVNYASHGGVGFHQTASSGLRTLTLAQCLSGIVWQPQAGTGPVGTIRETGIPRPIGRGSRSRIKQSAYRHDGLFGSAGGD